MGNENTQAPEETQNTETQTQEQAPEESQEQQEQEGQETEAKAQDEGQEAQSEEEKPAEEEQEEKPAQDIKPEGHRRSGGYVRKIERLERQLEQALALAGHKPPAQGAPGAKEKTPSEQAADYIDSLVSQKLAEAQAREQAARQNAEFQKRLGEARAAHPDFDDVLEDVAHIPVSPAINEAILTAENPGEIMYQLGRNSAELARISALPPLLQAREIGKLEAKLASGAAPQKPKTAARPPAPPSKVGGSASSTRSLEDLPISDYKRAYRSGRR
jgi:hypothetical protein